MDKITILEAVNCSLDGIKTVSFKKGEKITPNKIELSRLISIGAVLDPSLDKKEAEEKRSEILKAREEGIEKFQASRKEASKKSSNPVSQKKIESLEKELLVYKENEENFQKEKDELEEDKKAFEEDKEAYDNGDFIKASEGLLEQSEAIEKDRAELEKAQAELKDREIALEKGEAALKKSQAELTKALKKTNKK